MATLGNRAKNARRQAERRIAELDRQYYAATTEQSRRQIQARINDINEAISETRMYSGGKKIAGRTTAQREAAVARLEDINRSVELPRYSSIRRSNDVFKRNVNLASKGEATDVMSENELRAFWRATQKAWEGKGSVKDRYREIQQYYGTNDLQLIFDVIMEENAGKVMLLNRLKGHERLTGEEKEMLQQLMREDDDLEKRYRANDDRSPIVGLVASSIDFMSYEEFWEAVEYRKDSYYD